MVDGGDGAGLTPSQKAQVATSARRVDPATEKELRTETTELAGETDLASKPGKFRKTKEFVMRNVGTIGLGVGGIVALGVLFGGAAEKQKCLSEWRQTYPEYWEGDTGSMGDTKSALKEKVHGKSKEERDARIDEAYAALAKCDDSDYLGSLVQATADAVIKPLAGTASGVLKDVLGPISAALEPFKYGIVAFLCILALGLLYRLYGLVAPRPALNPPSPPQPPQSFGGKWTRGSARRWRG